MALGKLELHLSERQDSEPDDEEDLVAYVSLPAHPGRGTQGVVKKQIRLRDLVGDHGSLDVYLDFDGNGQLIGMELVD